MYHYKLRYNISVNPCSSCTTDRLSQQCIMNEENEEVKLRNHGNHNRTIGYPVTEFMQESISLSRTQGFRQATQRKIFLSLTP